jgi:hypothetical protein
MSTTFWRIKNYRQKTAMLMHVDMKPRQPQSGKQRITVKIENSHVDA